MTTLISAYAQSDFFGKLIFLGLFSLSIICWIVLIHKIWMTRKVKKIAPLFYTTLEKNRDRLLALELTDLPRTQAGEAPHPLTVLFLSLKHKTVEVLNKNHFFAAEAAKTNKTSRVDVYLSPADLELVESHGLMAISSQMKKMEKNVFVLSTIVTLAPFLGLLGTVWGILITFSALQGGASANSNSVILGGLSTALVTTVLGLVIAIPALVAYNYLRNTLKDLSSDMEDFLYLALSTLELQYRKVDLE
jgi:biopolymer transport protein TolQ